MPEFATPNLPCSGCGHEGCRCDQTIAILRNDLHIATTQVSFLQRRITQLQEANNREVLKRRKLEADANQEYAEKLLVRQECMRQRERAEKLVGFIEELPLEHIPSDVRAAMEATFPPVVEPSMVPYLQAAYDLGHEDAINDVATGCKQPGFSVERVIEAAAEEAAS